MVKIIEQGSSLRPLVRSLNLKAFLLSSTPPVAGQEGSQGCHFLVNPIAIKN